MTQKIRRWEDSGWHWEFLLFWLVLLGLILYHGSLGGALALAIVGGAAWMPLPLRGLDAGRMVWGFWGVIAGTAGALNAATASRELFWSFVLFWAFGYMLGAWRRCRLERLKSTLLLVAAIIPPLAVIAGVPTPPVTVWGWGILATLCIGIFWPMAFLRALLVILARTLFRIRLAETGSVLPDRGALLLVANHVSFLDFVFILAITPRPVRFLVSGTWYRQRLNRWYLRHLGFLEVPESGHPKALGDFLYDTKRRLRRGEAIAVYPEGGISRNGLTGGFRRGISMMLPDDVKVAVIPLHLGLYWGRLFAWEDGKLHFIPPLRWPIPITMTVGEELETDLSRYRLWGYICEMGAVAETLHQYWELPLHVMFAHMAFRHPHKLVFSDFEGQDLANWEMLTRALLLSKAIRRMAPEDRFIGVFLPGTTAAAASILGIMFADKSPALLNFTVGMEALQSAIDQAGLKCILTSRLFLSKLKMEPLPGMVMLEDVAKATSRPAKLLAALAARCVPPGLLVRHYAPESFRDLDRIGAILFTSGSSGKPKGVVLSHHNINSDVFSFWRVLGRDKERGVILGHMPLFHSFGLTVAFWFPVMSGTRVCYMPNPLDAAKVCRVIRERGISLLIATPTFLQNYCRKAQPGDFDSLEIVITGAEKLRPEVIAQVEELTPLTVTEGYGCTELSPICAVNFAQSCFSMGRKVGKPGSIGQPLPGIAARTVDPEDGRVLDADEVGLLEIKGPNVMQGYLNEPELTAAVIHDGWYNTGDLARIDADGYIFITGRQSRFSKIGGEMVPHELVEKRLSEFFPADIPQFAVTGCKDAKRGERLLVFHTVVELDIAWLMVQLRESGMPNLWIPKSDDFVAIAAIPILATGKLDIQALRRLADSYS